MLPANRTASVLAPPAQSSLRARAGRPSFRPTNITTALGLAVVLAGCDPAPSPLAASTAGAGTSAAPENASAVTTRADQRRAGGADATEAWQAIATAFPGRWIATTPSGKSIEVSYHLMSNGSALVETYGSQPERQTLSVYHPDGIALAMTHYCGQGNQARLRAKEATATRISFALEAATNVAADMSVLHELVFVLGDGTLERTEVYVAPGVPPARTVLSFHRVDGT